jgi:hypothetical protein
LTLGTRGGVKKLLGFFGIIVARPLPMPEAGKAIEITSLAGWVTTFYP